MKLTYDFHAAKPKKIVIISLDLRDGVLHKAMNRIQYTRSLLMPIIL